MRRQLFSGLMMTVSLIVVTGLLYPLAVFVIGRSLFNDNARGSFVTNSSGQVVGSALLGQRFVDASGHPDSRYFQPRPSAAGDGYDPTKTGGSNLGPSNPKLIAPASGPDCYLVDRTGTDGNPVIGADGKTEQECYGDTVPARIDAYRTFNKLASDAPVPIDAVTASGSGVDPHISVANAKLQAARVAAARNLSLDKVMAAIGRHTTDRQWGFLGEKVVNVLMLNLDLDHQT